MEPIYARITIEGEPKAVSTGVWCLPDDRLNDEKRIEGSTIEAAMANLALAEFKAEVDAHFLVLCKNYTKVSAARVKNVFEGRKPEEDKKSK